MYKVFFNERAIFLTDEFGKNFQVKYGLFYKYRSVEDLKELINFFNKLRRINSLYIFHHDIEALREAFKQCFTNIDAAGGLIVNQEGKHLFIWRREKWDLPKGKVDGNESYQKAAIREIQEECGLSSLEIAQPLLNTYHTYPLNNQLVLKKTYWFYVRETAGEQGIPQMEEEITELRWCGYDELAPITENTYQTILDVLKYANLIRM